jgi:hypothetical protein
LPPSARYRRALAQKQSRAGVAVESYMQVYAGAFSWIAPILKPVLDAAKMLQLTPGVGS